MTLILIRVIKSELDEFSPSDDSSPQLFNQHELSDLTRALNLPKETAELLGSRLKAKNILAQVHHSHSVDRVRSIYSIFRRKEVVCLLQ